MVKYKIVPVTNAANPFKNQYQSALYPIPEARIAQQT